MSVSAPQNVSIIDDTIHHELTLDWDEQSAADGYYLYRAQQSGSGTEDYTQVADVSTPPVTDSELKSGEKYYYRVTAYAGTESSPSTEVTATVKLLAPVNLQVSNIQSYSVDLAWTNNNNIGGQRVYYTNEDDNVGPIDDSGLMGENTESYTLSSLDKDTTYTVSVEAETDHATSQDTAITFDVQSGNTVEEDSHLVVQGTYRVAGNLEVLDYE